MENNVNITREEEVIYIKGIGIDSKGDSTLEEWLSYEIDFDRYYLAFTDKDSVFIPELTTIKQSYGRYSRKLFETKQERRERNLKDIIDEL